MSTRHANEHRRGGTAAATVAAAAAVGGGGGARYDVGRGTRGGGRERGTFANGHVTRRGRLRCRGSTRENPTHNAETHRGGCPTRSRPPSPPGLSFSLVLLSRSAGGQRRVARTTKTHRRHHRVMIRTRIRRGQRQPARPPTAIGAVWGALRARTRAGTERGEGELDCERSGGDARGGNREKTRANEWTKQRR